MNHFDKAQHLHIGDFRDIVIPPDGESRMRLSVGDRVYAIEKFANDSNENRQELLLFTVTEEHNGAEINLKKHIKKARKAKG